MATSFFGGAFFGGEFFNSSSTVTRDTHDGVWRQKTYRDDSDQEEGFRKKREERESLREQIRLAIEGPDAPVLVPALEGLSQEGPEPLEDRVDIGELVAQVELWKAVREAAEKSAQLFMDDEEVLLLL